MTLKAVGYRRTATINQGGDSYHLAGQQRAIEEFVHRQGWQLGPLYIDAGFSGRLDQRPALCQLLQDAAAGHCDVVLIQAVDR